MSDLSRRPKDLDEMTNAAVEGDDIADDPPIPVRLFGPYFAATDQISVTGEYPLRTLAQNLFDNGAEATRVLEIYRGGALISRTTVAAAAGIDEHER